MNFTIKTRVLAIVMYCLALFAYGQEYTISGKVLDEQRKPVSFGTVLLLKAVDSSYIKGLLQKSMATLRYRSLYPEVPN